MALELKELFVKTNTAPSPKILVCKQKKLSINKNTDIKPNIIK